MDVRLKGLNGELDVSLGTNGDLLADDGMRTAVALSLLSDRRARADDALPDGTTDRRGWWADALADRQGDQFGSRLWLLSREKDLEEVRRRAEGYAREALQWLLDDRVATDIEVEARTVGGDRLLIDVAVIRGDGTRLAQQFDYVWR
ncbi:phage GP46 family protein [Marinobacter subterrani]|uniref:Mu-like prophage protein gp46 n=1 Tax=Marinobacter subterrani TaxID=1658765 RepID=A0A0J7J7A3_9GAMM|nr:phage GP46 family protein [Marinobacter subterrani]KMQ72830.1 Mu-like prophage protein gp46 [Marinobacter subterrani]KMQ73854.1 Mu-like prophage protein gp46 [Marinobacter subterrani]KMQ75319.1 Mu-like prophage protein gp46 [Marinobacter subterrani]